MKIKKQQKPRIKKEISIEEKYKKIKTRNFILNLALILILGVAVPTILIIFTFITNSPLSKENLIGGFLGMVEYFTAFALIMIFLNKLLKHKDKKILEEYNFYKFEQTTKTQAKILYNEFKKLENQTKED